MKVYKQSELSIISFNVEKEMTDAIDNTYCGHCTTDNGQNINC